jgi:hypothetical protein
MMNLRSVLVATAIIGTPFLFQAAPSRAAEIPWKIDKPMAARLVSEALRDNHSIVKWLEDSPDMSDPFFVFDGLNKPPRQGSFGYFAVNPWTGDVWALWGCTKVKSPTVQRSQERIKRRFTSQELAHYAELRDLKPECIVES